MFGLPTGNPVLQEIDGLSPAAKNALAMAHQNIAGAMQPPSAPAAPATRNGPTFDQVRAVPPPPVPISGPPDVPTSMGPAANDQTFDNVIKPMSLPTSGVPGLAPPPKPPADPDLMSAKAEYGRLAESPSGINQIHNSWARIPLQIADAIGSGLFPRIAVGVPGTQAHHNVLLSQAGRALNTQETAAQEDATTQRIQEQTREMPEVLEAKNEAAAAKREVDSMKANETHRNNDLKHKDSLTKLGEIETPEGDVVEDPNSPISKKRHADTDKAEAVTEYTAAREDLAHAQADLAKSKNDPKSPAFQQAQQKMQAAQYRTSIAEQRLGLSKAQFDMRAHGTDTQGNPLPGAMLGDDGKPVGTGFQHNVRPTGQERNKADLANSAHDQIQSMKDIIKTRPDIFGPMAGRKTEFTVWLGSQDPDAQRFRAARTIAGDHLAGVFGGRSEAALNALDSAIGHFKDNPAAVEAGLNQLDQANSRFMKAGTVKTAGSDAAKAPAGGGDMINVQVPGHPPGQIHASQKDAFLKRFPNAKVVQ